jgi:hypothetical protein
MATSKSNISMNDIEKIHRNLFRFEGKYYRLFAKGVTPNMCWLIAPKMVELIDIDIATGNDKYGKNTIVFDVTGTVSMYNEYIRI